MPFTRCFPAAALGAILLIVTRPVPAEICNLKVVTDASPDYSDLPSMVHSITSQWPAPAEKCRAMFYWNHNARRQTSPMDLHGMALTDPIRQFNDYGHTMCSTISGINCGIWHSMGLPTRYWDISNHTVSEVFYDGRWHMYDNSMSAIYTLCDGKTIAGVEDIGKEGACEASGGKPEPGHVAKYHCLTATSPRGFLTGADTQRSLDEEYRCFNPNGLKYRSYFFDWDLGHRYILNLKPGEVYTRQYKSLGKSPEFYVPNNGKDPEAPNERYHLRGNGQWTFQPSLKPGEWEKAVHSASRITADDSGLRPSKAGEAAEVVYKVQAANVVTSQVVRAAFSIGGENEGLLISNGAALSVSTDNGLHWDTVWSSAGTGDLTAEVKLGGEVNGSYEVLLKVNLWGARDAAPARLKDLEIRTTTQLNAKTQPKLNLGRNTVYVGAGEQTESIVFWPELQNGRYKRHVVDEKNVTSAAKHPGYQGVLHPTVAKEDAWVIYRLDAPSDVTRLTYGGRFFNRAKNSRIELHHSFDGGKTWAKSWSLTDTKQPWDVIHYETVDVPAGHRSVWVKYLMNTTDPSTGGCSIYAVRMEANHRPADAAPQPLEVTFKWSEVQADRSLVGRSHTQLVEKLPAKYTINVGGTDHPVMGSLTANLKGSRGGDVAYGYSDGKDAGGEKWVGKWETLGKNLAVGKPYTLSHPSETSWEAGDPDGTKLTDGVAGPPYAGGTSYRSGALWKDKTNPVITLDLGESKSCASFGMNFHGYPWHDALAGKVKDKVEVLVSEDGKDFRPVGVLNTDWRWKDLPVNHIYTDEETATGGTFRFAPPEPVKARYVRYKVTSARVFCATELEVLDSYKLEPFDLRVALPKP